MPRPRRCGRRLVLDKSAVAQFGDRLLELRARIHHDRPVPGHRLIDRLAGYQQEADATLAGLDLDLVAGVEQHERAVAHRLAHEQLFAVDLLFGENTERSRRRSKTAIALENVSEGMAFGFDLQLFAFAGRYHDVEIARVGG